MMDDQEMRALVAERLRELRKEKGFTAADFAGRIGVDAPRLSRMETCKQSISTLVLRRAAELLEVPMEAFFRRPPAAVSLMRTDDEGGQAAAEMVDWAKALRHDLDMVAEHNRGLAA